MRFLKTRYLTSIFIIFPLTVSAESLMPELFNEPIPGCSIAESSAWQKYIFTSTLPYITYPKVAQMRGWEGSGLASLDVNADGVAFERRLIKSTGYQILDMTMLDVLAKITKAPKTFPKLECATDHSKPISIAIPFSFRLREPTIFDGPEFRKH